MRLAAQVPDAVRVELEPQRVLVAGLELGNLEGLEEPIKQEEVVLFWVIRDNDHVANYPKENLVQLNVSPELYFREFSDACFDERRSLRDQIVGQSNLTEVDVEFEFERLALDNRDCDVAECHSCLQERD